VESLALAAFVLIGVVFLFAVVVPWRRRAMEQRRRQTDVFLGQTGRGGESSGGSAFTAPGFGSWDRLLDQMVSGSNVWSRSYAFDFKTGQWVDISDQQPDKPGGEEARQSGVGMAGARGPASKRMSGPRTRPAGMFGLLEGLDGTGDFRVESPDELTGFADVGGMEGLKQEIRDTIGLLLEHPQDADRYGIEWNGVLLHGPPGVGKTFLARAIAGEFGLNLLHVSTGDLVSSLVGGSARNIDRAFDKALQHLPCLLFFDEFDSVAQRRDTPDQESRRTVNQLLTSLEAHRDERRLLVMAATNSIEHLDPAVIRPGRFDRHIRIDLPDAEARRAVFRTELDDRPVVASIALDELVRRTEGMTPAAIERVVDIAALNVFRQAIESGRQLQLDTGHLLNAIEQHGGEDRPTVEHWTWDSLVLPPAIKAQLQQLQAVIEDPESARRFGVEPPTGLLLAGPPGTGKTTVAKVLAAQARCSFYPVSAADVMSKWVGESEQNLRRLFERARENRPSIIFIDEIDAIAGRRGEGQMNDSQVNQLLAEIDGLSGQRGVFVIGATNRPDQLDRALLRGGRLSRTIVLGLPDEAARLAILRLHTARMPTVAVRLEDIARETEGFSPADLKALVQEAGLAAMARTGRSSDQRSAVTPAAGSGARASAAPASAVAHGDFEEALTRMPARSPVRRF
jgi:transitional endoplasmic reticulum ATPase